MQIESKFFVCVQVVRWKRDEEGGGRPIKPLPDRKYVHVSEFALVSLTCDFQSCKIFQIQTMNRDRSVSTEALFFFFFK